MTAPAMPFGYSLGRNRADTHPAVHPAGSFVELQDAVLSARHDKPKAEAPYFARPFRANGAERPQRAKEYAEPVAYIVLDIDGLTPAAAVRLDEALAPWSGFWYASSSATQDNMKRRAVLACSRVVGLTEHAIVVAAFEAYLKARVGDGIQFDSAASGDLARLWYLPAEGAKAGYYVGDPVDVDKALARAKREAPPEPEPADGSGAKVGEGGRNAMLTREAGKLRRIGLSPTELLTALVAINRARCAPPLPNVEVETIARSVGRYDAGKQDEASMLGPVYDGMALLATPHAPTSWLVDGWISEGASVLLGAHGGTGKSLLALQLAVCLATGRPFLGLPTQRRKVMMYAAEDRPEVLHRRLRCIADVLAVPQEHLNGWFCLVDQSRRPAELMGRDRFGVFGFAPIYDALAHEIREPGVQVLVIDSASDAFGGSEIARAEVRRYIVETQRLVPEAGAVIHVVHVDKAYARNAAGGQGYSGSTAWHNSVRQRWELARPQATDDEGRGPANLADPADPRRTLILAKNNYGPCGATIALRFDPLGGGFQADPAQATGGTVDAIRDRTERDAILRAFLGCADANIAVPAALQGSRTAYVVLSQRPEFPDGLRGGRPAKRFTRHLEALRHIQHITESTLRRANRHATVTLEITPEGRAACAAFA